MIRKVKDNKEIRQYLERDIINLNVLGYLDFDNNADIYIFNSDINNGIIVENIQQQSFYPVTYNVDFLSEFWKSLSGGHKFFCAHTPVAEILLKGRKPVWHKNCNAFSLINKKFGFADSAEAIFCSSGVHCGQQFLSHKKTDFVGCPSGNPAGLFCSSWEPCEQQFLSHKSITPVNSQHKSEVLTLDDVNEVFNYRAYGDDPAVFAESIQNRDTECIRIDGELAAWCLIHEDNAIGPLYTKEKFRGQGLATIVMSRLIQKLLDKNITPFAQIWTTNLPSIALMKKLGFEHTHDCVYFGLIKRRFKKTID